MPSCCGVLPSASVAELALGVDALDAGVDVGLLILVDPPWWDPFGEPVGVDAAGPAFLQEMGVVVSAQTESDCKPCAKRTFAMTSRPLPTPS